jgi:aspartate/methionine/tyrosine aminotransferase
VLVTPAHQRPTGVVLAGHRRQQLIAWACHRDGIIIEADYDADFRYDTDPVGSLQGLAPACVISLGTVSKSLAPTCAWAGWLRPTGCSAPWPAASASPTAAAPASTSSRSPRSSSSAATTGICGACEPSTRSDARS